ncbi:dipeptidase [Kosakonia sp. BYX6]|uniref:Dipeptidase n=1 Tax=Kosakonia calanthes TaxID=3139408 RepID=A0ABZ3BBF5_9ENTR
MATALPHFPVFDGHNDLLLRLWIEQNPVERVFSGLTGGHLDFPRMQRAGFAGGLFAVFVPPARYLAQQRGISLAEAEAAHDPLVICHQQIDLFYRMAEASQGKMAVCRSARDIAQCLQSGTLALVLHMEGADALDAALTQFDTFVGRGVRSIGPFWNLPNAFGEGVNGPFPGSPDTGPGLSEAGKALIRACNQQRIMVDLSHMNAQAFWDTAELSTAPLVATHSNAHALCAQPRNLTDDQLQAIAASDGLVGVNFGTAFLRADGQRNGNTSLTKIFQHIEYLVTKLGEDRVAFGSDFDGIELPDELGDVTGLPRLMAVLMESGVDRVLAEKLAWRNWLRVLKMTWGD